MHAGTNSFPHFPPIIFVSVFLSKMTEQLLTCGRKLRVKLHTYTPTHPTTNHVPALGGHGNWRSLMSWDHLVLAGFVEVQLL